MKFSHKTLLTVAVAIFPLLAATICFLVVKPAGANSSES